MRLKVSGQPLADRLFEAGRLLIRCQVRSIYSRSSSVNTGPVILSTLCGRTWIQHCFLGIMSIADITERSAMSTLYQTISNFEMIAKQCPALPGSRAYDNGSMQDGED